MAVFIPKKKVSTTQTEQMLFPFDAIAEVPAFILDPAYVHTDNNYSNAEKDKNTANQTAVNTLNSSVGQNTTAITNLTNAVNSEVANRGTEDTRVLLESKSYTDTQIANFDFIKIGALPTTGLPNRLYLVPKGTTGTNDLFEMWIWVNNNWEFEGSKAGELDLTNYYTKAEVNELIGFTKAQITLLKQFSEAISVAPTSITYNREVAAPSFNDIA